MTPYLPAAGNSSLGGRADRQSSIVAPNLRQHHFAKTKSATSSAAAAPSTDQAAQASQVLARAYGRRTGLIRAVDMNLTNT
jgi:hypothetical protein